MRDPNELRRIVANWNIYDLNRYADRFTLHEIRKQGWTDRLDMQALDAMLSVICDLRPYFCEPVVKPLDGG
jgi:hypothetical protein